MHRTRTRRRSAARMLSLAAVAGLGCYFNTAPDPANPPAGGGSGGGAPPADPPKPNTPSLDEQIAERLKSERAKWEAEAAAKAKREQEAAERKKAEEQGEFKKLADKAEERAAAAESRALAAERSTLIDDAFTDVASGENAPPIKSLREWVKPKVLAGLTADTTPEDVTKLAKQLAEQYAKDNPRQAKGSAGAPPAPRGPGSRPPEHGRNNGHQQPARQPSVAGSRF